MPHHVAPWRRMQPACRPLPAPYLERTLFPTLHVPVGGAKGGGHANANVKESSMADVRAYKKARM